MEDVYIYIGVNCCDGIDMEISHGKMSLHVDLNEENIEQIEQSLVKVRERISYLRQNKKY